MSVKESKYIDKTNRLVMTRLAKITDTSDRSFDIEFWQRLTGQQRMTAMWELVETAHSMKGGEPGDSDFNDLLRALNDEKVEYLIVGGYAVGMHTEPRYTKDIDIWVGCAQDNAERVFRALSNFGAPLENITAKDFTDQELFFQVGVEPVRIDILMGIAGLNFDDCWKRKKVDLLDNIETNFISIDDLITNKRNIGRPQDLIDADNLELRKKIEGVWKPLSRK